MRSPLPVDAAERAIAKRVPGHQAVLFASCRGALRAAVAVLAPSGSVGVTGYTCIAVPNAVLSAGAEPVYAEVDEFGLVPEDAWPQADVVIVQDSFGFRCPRPSDRPVVRDASLCSTDFSCDDDVRVTVTSFEQSKALAAGQGGLALTRDGELAEKLRSERDRSVRNGGGIRHVSLTMLSFLGGRACYRGWKLGSLGLALFGGLAPRRAAGYSPGELSAGGMDPALLGRPSPAAARIMVSQFERSETLARRRAHVVAIYDRIAGVQRTPPALVRYPMVVPDPNAFISCLRRAGWDVASRWFNAPLHPREAHALRFGLRVSPEANASRLAATIVNLPTHPLVSDRDAELLGHAAVDAGAEAVVPPQP